MDPITLALLLGGGYLGYKKVYPWAKNQVATFQSRFQLHGHAPQALPMQLDPGLSQAQLGEVANLLTNVRTASLVRAAADLYKSQNFPLAASVLDSRARALGG